MICNTFTGAIREKYAAFDTETHVYIDGVRLSEDQIFRMCAETHTVRGRVVPKYPVKWWREHCTVKAWAYIIYAPSGFAICETFDEFIDTIARYHIKYGYWYNAPFDMSILDWDMLSRGWKHVYRAQEPMTYSELASDYGARYSVDICAPYGKDIDVYKRSKANKWFCHMYDLRNLCPGGLANLLESYDIRDPDGAPIRKLEMDYQRTDAGNVTPEDIKYMLNDTRGLWYLAKAFSDRLHDRFGLRIDRGRPDVLTTSGLAKRILFNDIYPSKTYPQAVCMWQKDHPISIEEDEYFRKRGLLGGGLVMLNPKYKGKHLHNANINRYDYNQHYPAIMSRMPICTGHNLWYRSLDEAKRAHSDEECIYILDIDRLDATVRPGMIPTWRDPFRKEIVSDICITPEMPVMMFDFEFDELKHWYEGMESASITGVVVYRTTAIPAFRERILSEYARKAAAKKAKNKPDEIFSKLFGNGIGGKFSQNPRHFEISRVLCDDGHVAKVDGDETVDERSMMHVVQGAYVTAMGRTILRRSCREGCRDVSEELFYTDTDSIHTSAEFTDTDDYRLGALKKENKTPITDACFLAPKTYYEKDADGIEIHCKGINKDAIRRLLRIGQKIENIYKPGRRIQSLSALNVPGGKALLPLPKFIAKYNEEDELYE